jgi:hypothetical protein
LSAAGKSINHHRRKDIDGSSFSPKPHPGIQTQVGYRFFPCRLISKPAIYPSCRQMCLLVPRPINYFISRFDPGGSRQNLWHGSTPRLTSTSAAGRLPLQLHRNGTEAVRVQEARRPYLRRHRRAPGPATHRRTGPRSTAHQAQAQWQPRHCSADLSATPTPRAPRCARPLPQHHPYPTYTGASGTPCRPLIPCPLSPTTWAPDAGGRSLTRAVGSGGSLHCPLNS